MGLPKCHILKGTGNSVRVWKCKEEKKEFKPKTTECGVIPITKNPVKLPPINFRYFEFATVSVKY